METYWATVAQTLPPIALALILEVRGFGSYWATRRRGWRLLQAVLWGLFFAGATIVEIVALTALRADQTWPSAATIADACIGYGLGLLLLVPAVELFDRAVAPMWALAKNRLSMGNLRRLFAGRRLGRMQREYREMSSLASRYESIAKDWLAAGHENRANITKMQDFADSLAFDDPRREGALEWLVGAREWDASNADQMMTLEGILATRPDIEGHQARLTQLAAQAHDLRQRWRAVGQLSMDLAEVQAAERALGHLPVLPPPTVLWTDQVGRHAGSSSIQTRALKSSRGPRPKRPGAQ